MIPAPAVGRIVHIKVNPGDNNGSDIAPAVITRVWGEPTPEGRSTVNLRVLYDGPAVPPQGSWRQDWMTSALLYPTREAMEASEYPASAFWPPRVEDQREPGDRPPRH